MSIYYDSIRILERYISAGTGRTTLVPRARSTKNAFVGAVFCGEDRKNGTGRTLRGGMTSAAVLQWLDIRKKSRASVLWPSDAL